MRMIGRGIPNSQSRIYGMFEFSPGSRKFEQRENSAARIGVPREKIKFAADLAGCRATHEPGGLSKEDWDKLPDGCGGETCRSGRRPQSIGFAMPVARW